MKKKDDRIKLMNEILSGMKVRTYTRNTVIVKRGPNNNKKTTQKLEIFWKKTTQNAILKS